MVVKKKKRVVVKKKVTKRNTSNALKFDESKLTIIENLLRKGYIVSEVAELIGITETTYYNWKKNYPDYFKLEGLWKENAVKECERALVKLTQGVVLRETKAFMNKNGSIKIVEVMKQLPPNQKSIEFHLKNRAEKDWKDKIQHDIGGEGLKEFTLNYKQGDSNKNKEET